MLKWSTKMAITKVCLQQRQIAHLLFEGYSKKQRWNRHVRATRLSFISYPWFTDRLNQVREDFRWKARKAFASSSTIRIHIVVENIKHFAFGIYKDGMSTIWAAGQAGWFEILRPMGAYKSIFNDMIEGVSLLYHLVDIYGSKGRQMSVERLFHEYGSAHRMSPTQVKERFCKHALFLTARMSLGDEGITWKDTTIYQYLREQYPHNEVKRKRHCGETPQRKRQKASQPLGYMPGGHEDSLQQTGASNRTLDDSVGCTGIKKSVSFLSLLPPELRDQVYRDLLTSKGSITISQSGRHRPALAAPLMPLAIMRTNKKTRNEAMGVYVTQNKFVIDLSIETANDFLSGLPPTFVQQCTSLTLGRAMMSGFFWSSPRDAFVQTLFYKLKLKTLSIQVPDDDFGTGDYCWLLLRELVEFFFLEGNMEELRLVYPNSVRQDIASSPKTLLELFAIKNILYLDQDYDASRRVERIDKARVSGQRAQFKDKHAIEAFVRSQRTVRNFAVGLRTKEGGDGLGTEIRVRRNDVQQSKSAAPMFDVRELVLQGLE